MELDLCESYFITISSLLDWQVYGNSPCSYKRLLRQLYDTEFIARGMDKNRVVDALDFRKALGYGALTCEEHPVGILEVMISLSSRIENDIMRGTSRGDRTSVWFWEMVKSLGLLDMTDDVYDARYVGDVLDRFLNKRYSSNGQGGLFTVINTSTNLRDTELWYQAALYLNKILVDEGFIES